jgi:hypothetical protein
MKKIKLMRQLVHTTRDYIHTSREYKIQCGRNSNRNIQFYNWWSTDSFDRLWFYRFVENCGLLKNSSKRICFFSVFGDRNMVGRVPSDLKVFFTGENVHLEAHRKYGDSLLDDKDCDFSMGFDFIEEDNYLRFPLWLIYMFEPYIDSQRIAKKCEELRWHTDTIDRQRFAALIARADILGIRTEMYDALSTVGRVDCPSTLLHNDDTLKTQFNDNKQNYLGNYIFNICPENSNSYGYVTEKLFQAIAAGCIPIYWGSFNAPELKVLNQDAIVFWDREDGCAKAVQKVRDLVSDSKQLKEFMQQPRLQPTAEEEIEKMIVGLYDRLKELINNI